MHALEIFDDCRKHVKDWGSEASNNRDWFDWRDVHHIEFKYQRIIRDTYLSHCNPTYIRDLVRALRRDHLLGWNSITQIIKHLIYNNKFIEVHKYEHKFEQKDYLNWKLYLYPRLDVNIKVPYSLLPLKYYHELRKLKGIKEDYE